MYVYDGLDHGSVAVVLLGFAISWQDMNISVIWTMDLDDGMSLLGTKVWLDVAYRIVEKELEHRWGGGAFHEWFFHRNSN